MKIKTSPELMKALDILMKRKQEPQYNDTDRLPWIMTDIDGIAGIKGDHYDWATKVAKERGNEGEPTLLDELEGFRRMIDEAIRKQQ